MISLPFAVLQFDCKANGFLLLRISGKDEVFGSHAQGDGRLIKSLE